MHRRGSLYPLGQARLTLRYNPANIGDPSFADVFILEGGLPKLRYLTLHTTGNTLAYSLTSFSRLLEVDKGWDYVNQDLVKRVKFCLDNREVAACVATDMKT